MGPGHSPSMPSIVPYFGYSDGPAAVEFLCSAFGLERVNVVEEPEGFIAHAELRHGDDLIMLGSWLDEQEPGTPVAGSGVYLVVDDVDDHHAQAVEAGAQVVYPPEDSEWGTRRWRGRDLENYEWSFGTYTPGQSWD